MLTGNPIHQWCDKILQGAELNDWRDGFLFLGNHLTLDFLNTRPVMAEGPLELLPDPSALARWLGAAGVLPSHEATQFRKSWCSETPASLGHLLAFREALRQAVLQMEDGAAPTFLPELNRLLTAHPGHDQVVEAGRTLQRRRVYQIRTPPDAFAPLLDATVDLLTAADWSKIRKCATCVLHFYDTSKRGGRRWCSMQLCGNRAKVAAYYRRTHAPETEDPPGHGILKA